MKKNFYRLAVPPPATLFSAALLCLFSLSQVQAEVASNVPGNRNISPTVTGKFLPDAKEEIEVTGTVRDKQGPLPGATIIVKNTNRGTTADANGRFRITVNRNETLVFSMLGYQNAERVVDNAEINVVMTMDAKQLSEVVVVGYGSTTQSDVTGAISSIKSGDFNAGVNNAPDQLLQGKVAGLNVTRSGDPNANASIILRGPSTLRTGAAQEPFYVIDGVPGASIQVVAPNDIVSIDVLKDASATAIYGSRAANGVIIVTTRRAKQGEPVLSYNGYAAVENISNQIDMLSADELRAFLTANNKTAGKDDGVSTDWQKEVSRTGISHNHNLSLMANTGKTSYDASINYLNNEGIIKNSSLDRLILRGRVEQQAFKDKLKLSISISNSVTNQKTFPVELLSNMLNFMPTLNIKDETGLYREDYVNGVLNPVSLLDNNENDAKIRTFLANGIAELQLLPGLKYTLSLASQDEQVNRNIYFGRLSGLAQNAGGVALRNAYSNTRKVLESYFNYDKTFDRHNLGLLAGYSWQQDRTGEGFQTSSQGFTSDVLTYNNLGLSSPRPGFVPNYGNTTIQTLRLISFYGRVNYSFNEKYLFQASLRQDGSSAFGVNNRWGLFPAFSAGWRLTQEEFLKGFAFLNDLKLRVGYGVTGNSLGFDPMIATTRYGSTGYFYYNGQLTNSIGPTQNQNPDLKWERTAMTNVGVDFSVLNGRLGGAVDFYDKNTSDLIWNYPVSTTQYFVNTLIANVGEMNNRGVEVQLNAVPIDKPNFSWRTSFNVAHNKNKIETLSNEKFSLTEIKTAQLGGQGQSGNTSQIIREGMPLGTFNIWHFVGKNDQGVSQFQKADGTITTTPSSLDFTIAGNAQPKLLYGWNNTFKYGNFDLNFFVRGVYGNKILNATLANLNNPAAAQIRNIPKFTLNESTNDFNAYFVSDRFLESGSYLRMDNASLGYTFASESSNTFKNLRVYVTGTNLFTITDYKGIDPEISLGGIEPGIDNRNFYPKTRSFLLGVNVSF
ncbi:SusC/RagA family TonB-linked outer membrane protein [Adhaeribacter rhizoryzae]|uniref:SusC/RagA family TonB-linked outer membrane protein n=1 Tax=Adhaeribacter rhizoryzae TaxID=2607907 RepID=A0A5M6D1R1_9BACT|nr:SusC/RagA family TonB-linked outer membrane protein [Adhaeribacter rhizoryzae]KAA5540560.1 SusC/RagA family TonB-linked outer membrane protein [Adhaeribacter rhizoryzae]